MKETLRLIPQEYKGLQEFTMNMYQEIGQPGRNGQISRKIQFSKTESRRSRKPEQTNNNY